ncbi:DEAD/DEAH box helicase, partial [Volvox carteri f. nagariensis]
GSGKTLAYLLPVLAALMTRNRVQGSKNCASPEALVLVPTRELAEQVFSDVQLLLRGTHLKALAVHGGVSLADQVLAIRGSAGGVDLLVATPGRLLQLVEQRRAVRLNRLGVLVVDEADRLMDLGMWPDLRRLLSQPGLPTARQTALVAASQLREHTPLAEAASELLRDALTIAVGDGSGTSGVVRQHVELVSDEQKLGRLLELLAPGAAGGPAVVFTRSLTRAEEVARYLSGRGISVAMLHSDLTQAQRDEAMQCFRFGVTSVLVATALASRGLNFPDVDLVVNYDVPASLSVYLHQVGRTGRGGRPGAATTLVTLSNRPSAPWLLDCLRRSGSPVPVWLEEMAAAA